MSKLKIVADKVSLGPKRATEGESTAAPVATAAPAGTRAPTRGFAKKSTETAPIEPPF